MKKKVLIILLLFIIASFIIASLSSHIIYKKQKAQEQIISLNENATIKLLEIILSNRVMYYIAHNYSYPSNFSEFMDGFDMGGDMGKIHVNEFGNIELLGYKFIYYSDKDTFKLVAEPILPGTTGLRYFAVGSKSDGTRYLAEDLNKNGKADPNEPQIKP